MFLIPKSSYKIKKIKNKGRGIFVTKDIEAGTIIGDYLGKIIDDKYLDEYEKKFGFYAMTYTKKSSIFPDLNLAGPHLINHSCSQNCESYKYHGHMIYFALRKIFAGEELTINYGIPLDDDFTSNDPCFCQSPTCNGSLYCTQEKSKKLNIFLKKQDKKYYNKMQTSFEQNLPPLKKYPNKIRDYKIFDLYANLNKKPFICQETSLPTIKIIRQRIRENGRCLKFPKINLVVYGIMNQMIISRPNNK